MRMRSNVLVCCSHHRQCSVSQVTDRLHGLAYVSMSMSTPDLTAARSLRLLCVGVRWYALQKHPKGWRSFQCCTHPVNAGLLCGCEYGNACARWAGSSVGVARLPKTTLKGGFAKFPNYFGNSTLAVSTCT